MNSVRFNANQANTANAIRTQNNNQKQHKKLNKKVVIATGLAIGAVALYAGRNTKPIQSATSILKKNIIDPVKNKLSGLFGNNKTPKNTMTDTKHNPQQISDKEKFTNEKQRQNPATANNGGANKQTTTPGSEAVLNNKNNNANTTSPTDSGTLIKNPGTSNPSGNRTDRQGQDLQEQKLPKGSTLPLEQQRIDDTILEFEPPKDNQSGSDINIPDIEKMPKTDTNQSLEDIKDSVFNYQNKPGTSKQRAGKAKGGTKKRKPAMVDIPPAERPKPKNIDTQPVLAPKKTTQPKNLFKIGTEIVNGLQFDKSKKVLGTDGKPLNRSVIVISNGAGTPYPLPGGATGTVNKQYGKTEMKYQDGILSKALHYEHYSDKIPQFIKFYTDGHISKVHENLTKTGNKLSSNVITTYKKAPKGSVINTKTIKGQDNTKILESYEAIYDANNKLTAKPTVKNAATYQDEALTSKTTHGNDGTIYHTNFIPKKAGETDSPMREIRNVIKFTTDKTTTVKWMAPANSTSAVEELVSVNLWDRAGRLITKGKDKYGKPIPVTKPAIQFSVHSKFAPKDAAPKNVQQIRTILEENTLITLMGKNENPLLNIKVDGNSKAKEIKLIPQGCECQAAFIKIKDGKVSIADNNGSIYAASKKDLEDLTPALRYNKLKNAKLLQRETSPDFFETMPDIQFLSKNDLATKLGIFNDKDGMLRAIAAYEDDATRPSCVFLFDKGVLTKSIVYDDFGKEPLYSQYFNSSVYDFYGKLLADAQ